MAEINAVDYGQEPILIADAFGRLLGGEWQQAANQQIVPVFPGSRARRIAWRTVTRQIQSAHGAPGTVMVRFAEQLPSGAKDERTAMACLRGLSQVVQKLEITNPTPVTVYVYPDQGSKKALTGNPGDGHADIISHSVHVIEFEAPVLERMLAHEGTHLLCYDSWGAPRTPLFGEGLAVWVAANYGGKSLENWKAPLHNQAPAVNALLSKGFFQLPEQQSYPLAGSFVDAAIRKVGLAKIHAYLYRATSTTWEGACHQAGTNPAELESAWRRNF